MRNSTRFAPAMIFALVLSLFFCSSAYAIRTHAWIEGDTTVEDNPEIRAAAATAAAYYNLVVGDTIQLKSDTIPCISGGDQTFPVINAPVTSQADLGSGSVWPCEPGYQPPHDPRGFIEIPGGGGENGIWVCEFHDPVTGLCR